MTKLTCKEFLNYFKDSYVPTESTYNYCNTSNVYCRSRGRHFGLVSSYLLTESTIIILIMYIAEAF